MKSEYKRGVAGTRITWVRLHMAVVSNSRSLALNSERSYSTSLATQSTIDATNARLT